MAWVAPLRALPAVAASRLSTSDWMPSTCSYPPWGASRGRDPQGRRAARGGRSRSFSPCLRRARRNGGSWRLPRRLRGVSAGCSAPSPLSSRSMWRSPRSAACSTCRWRSVSCNPSLASAAFAALMIGLLLTPFTPQPPEVCRRARRRSCGAANPQQFSRHAPLWLKLPLWLIVLGILGLAVLGLRGAGAVPGPAAGDDRHRRRRGLAALSRHPRGDARAPAAALSGRRDARGALRPRCAAPQPAGAAHRDRADVRPRHLRAARS